VRVGVQFTATLGPRASARWFTHSWPQAWHVLWNVVPTTPLVGGPEIEWEVEVERSSADLITYWITIKNLTSSTVNVESRFAVLN